MEVGGGDCQIGNTEWQRSLGTESYLSRRQKSPELLGHAS